MKQVTIYTDGACSGNPGRGGWAAVLIFGTHTKIISGGEPETTNNRMELMGAIEGLKALKEKCEVTIYSDSRYVVDGMSGWILHWMMNDWKKKDGTDPANVELWRELQYLREKHRVTFKWIKGHSRDVNNSIADQNAVAAKERQTRDERIFTSSN